MTFVRTVRGDVDPAGLGAIDYHEHLFHRSPLLPGEDLTDPKASGVEFGSLLASGFDGMIDATPIGLGRRPLELARIADDTAGVIVAATGRHRDAHYSCPLPIADDDLADAFERELCSGMPVDDQEYADGEIAPAVHSGVPVRAGVIKAATDYWRISGAEHVALRAAGEAHRRTGAPIMVHTERLTVVFEILEILRDSGADVSSVAIAHADRNPDPVLHMELAAAGVFLGYDGCARFKDFPESVLVACMAAVVEAGYVRGILLGGDVARRSSFRALGGLPGIAYIGERYVPRLRRVLGDEAVDTILRANPARFLTWRPTR